MAQIRFKFFASNRLPSALGADIQSLISQHPNAPLPETPSNSMIFGAFLGAQLIGYASLTITQKNAELTSIFITPAQQRQMHGFQFMLNILETLTKSGCQSIKLRCNEDALGFFMCFGFVIHQEAPTPNTTSTLEFALENPCPELFLKQLKSTLKKLGRSLEDFKKHPFILKLNEDSTHYRYAHQADYLDFHRSMLSQAQRQIWLSADTIQSPLLKDDKIRDCILRLAKRNAKAEIRILLEDDKKGAGYYNPTIDLAQKLTSFVEIRCTPPGVKKPDQVLTIVDFSGGILRKDHESYNGFANFHNTLIAQRLRDKFEHDWQYAKPSMQLRRLSL